VDFGFPALCGFLAIAFGVFAFKVEHGQKCYAPEKNGNARVATFGIGYVDVGKEFQVFLTLGFGFLLAAFILGLAHLLTCIGYWRRLILIVISRALSFLFVLAVVIAAHFVRLMHPGRVCSGDFVKSEEAKKHYLEQRGLFMLIFLIVSWVTIGCLLLLSIIWAVRSKLD